ncbi:MAG: hypothetical protein U0359_18565 [Byssovorax sp.]
MARAVSIALSLLALATTSRSAAADPPPLPPKPASFNMMEALRSGDDLVAEVPLAATLSNTWSGPLSFSWVASGRLFAGPIEQSVSSFLVARVLNGTTWSILLGLELYTIRKLGHGWGFLDRVSFNAEQAFGFGVPTACIPPYDARACGVGLGGVDELRGHLRGTPWVFSLTGGWIQGRVATDERRTVMESTWLFSPMAAQIEAEAKAGPIRARAAIGPGLYFGMHTAHAHPETRQNDLDIPWHGLYPLDGGIGIGARADAGLSLGNWVSLGGTLIVAPMLGRSIPDLDRAIAPVRSSAGESFLSWRNASAGLTLTLPGTRGAKVGLRYWVGELSSRPMYRAGHQAVTLRWEVPLRP